MKKVLQGNEAIARGAWEAGVTVAAAYPGTPSSEILTEIAKYPEIYSEWSPNEKVAMEVAAGAAYTGARALVRMKHVGLNVASDPFMTLSYTGIKGGLVIVVADDPFAHSSQNEQDSRNWVPFREGSHARAGRCPGMQGLYEARFRDQRALRHPRAFEGADKDIPRGFSCRGRGQERAGHGPGPRQKGHTQTYDVLANVRTRRRFVEERMKALKAYADEFPGNSIKINDPAVGIIAAGAPYMYARETFPGYSYLKLGMVWPLPKN